VEGHVGPSEGEEVERGIADGEPIQSQMMRGDEIKTSINQLPKKLAHF